MRLIHLSDLHLGIRQFQRQTPAGMNQREADVAGVFQRTIDRIIERAPDLVVIAGDVFHNVRPPNPAILHTFQQLSRLTRALPQSIIVMVAGNHDTPRAVETGCILRLFSPLGIHVVDTEPRRLTFAERSLSVLAVPDVPGAPPAFEIDPTMSHNVLVMHGDMPGSLPNTYGYSEPAALNVAPEEVKFAQWSYCAFGHHHVFHSLAPNACYSGSLEYTSVNIWGEYHEEKAAKLPGKGFIEYDLERRKRTFHKVEPARPIIDLPVIVANGLTAADVDAAITANVKALKGGVDDRIVRQVIRDIPRHVARELDHRMLRDLRRRALHFHLDTRRPELLRALPVTGATGRRPSLIEMVQERLWSRPLAPDIERQALVDLGMRYLRDADAREEAANVAAISPEGE
ncbi:MAG: metallophosphoesterase [Gemmatimonadaceae bacterium]|nr:metallophosphoesterase [Gemmatimonadaceae bacterium]